MSHSDVVHAIDKWIRGKGYKVDKDEGYVLDRFAKLYIRPDIVAIDKGIRIGIECKGMELDNKRSEVYRALGQMVLIQTIFPAVYLATCSKIFTEPFFYNRLRGLGIGMLYVDDKRVKVIHEPENSVKGIRRKKKKTSNLHSKIDNSIISALEYFEPMPKRKLIEYCSAMCGEELSRVEKSVDDLLTRGFLERAEVRVSLV